MANNHSNSYKLSPKDIVEDGIRFCVPLYQRLFTWSTIEVNQLLNDLKNHFDKENKKQYDSDDKVKPYYLGMITVVKRAGRYDLIDGQQRLTALTLLSIGFLHVLNNTPWYSFYEDSNRVFYNGRTQDRDFLRKLVDKHNSKSQSDNIAEGLSRKNMEEGLSCIESYLNSKENFSDSKALNKFANQVYNSLVLFVTELPEHYVETPSSLNEYFEAMNSSGKSLEQHEILKVELLKDQSDSEKLTFTKLWNVISNLSKPLFNTSEELNKAKQIEQYISNIAECRNGNFSAAIGRIIAGQNNPLKNQPIAEIPIEKVDFGKPDYRDRWDAVISFPQFLLMVLAIHLQNDSIAKVHPTRLLATFKSNPLNDVTTFYHQLLYYRLLMDLYVVRMKYSSSSGTHKLIFNNEVEQTEHAHERLKQYESMLEVSTEPHLWILPLLKHIASLQNAPTQIELLLYLTQLDQKIHGAYCPNISNMDFDHKPRYWMWRLDYAIWEKNILEGKDSFGFQNVNTEAIRQYEFRENRSLEHLHPQDQSNNDDWDSLDVNSFGNLAMISNSFNSSQSNKHVHEKFANLEVQINNKSLQSLKLYFMYLIARKSSEEWKVTVKDEHADEMIKILSESLEKYRTCQENIDIIQ